MSILTSRDNPRVRRWRDLVRDAAERRKAGSAKVEGAHLVAACLQAQIPIKFLLLSKSAAERSEFAALAERSGKTPVLLSEAL